MALEIHHSQAGTIDVMDRVCAVCDEPIGDEERWFRVREEFVHLSCSEKYLRMVSERRQQAGKTAPGKPLTDTVAKAPEAEA